MTGVAPDSVEFSLSQLRCRILLAYSRFEIIHEIELEVIHGGRIDFIVAASGIRVGRRIDSIRGTIQHHAGGSYHSCPSVGIGQIRVVGFEAHLFMERADYKFPNRNRAALGEERLHPKIGINTLNVRRVHCSRRRCGNRAVIDSLAPQRQGNRMTALRRKGDSLLTNISQISGNFIGQHLFQS